MESAELKIVLHLWGDRALVGIQQKDCDPGGGAGPGRHPGGGAGGRPRPGGQGQGAVGLNLGYLLDYFGGRSGSVTISPSSERGPALFAYRGRPHVAS